jgi:hypothetical protein
MSLSKGQFTLGTDHGNVLISYREHDTGNGTLLVDVDDTPLTKAHLLELAEQLTEEESRIQRARGGIKKTTTKLVKPVSQFAKNDMNDLDKDD